MSREGPAALWPLSGANSSAPFSARIPRRGPGSVSPNESGVSSPRLSSVLWRELRKARRISPCIRKRPVSIEVARRSRQKSEVGMDLVRNKNNTLGLIQVHRAAARKVTVRQAGLFKIEHAMLAFSPIRPDVLDPKRVFGRYRVITRRFLVGGRIAS